MGERTEEPTGRRLGEARSRGQVARSVDLSSAVLLTAVVILTIYFAQGVVGGMGVMLRYCLSEGALGRGLTPESIGPDVALAFSEGGRVVAPVMLLLAVVAFLSAYYQVGWVISWSALAPKWGKLNFFTGFGKLLNRRAAVKGGLDLLKMLVIGSVAVMVVRSEYALVVGLANLDLVRGLIVGGELARRLASWVLAVLFVLGIMDFRFQKWQHSKDLKMTKHEVKEERRSSEGDLETKGRRFKLARQIALQRLGMDVPKADVVVTNPTHFAVALKYDAGSGMRAPKVIAKGADYLALKIRYIAAANGVPIIERPPLARALYNEVPVGREIPPGHYEAVAEILAYVYRLDGRMAS